LTLNPRAHLIYIFIYTLVVSFFSQKQRANGDLILKGFLHYQRHRGSTE